MAGVIMQSLLKKTVISSYLMQMNKFPIMLESVLSRKEIIIPFRSIWNIKQKTNNVPFMPLVNLSRGIKYKDVLTKRCEHCYFQKVEDRWFVFCTKHPRHKQGQKIDIKSKWIITHCTHGTKKY